MQHPIIAAAGIVAAGLSIGAVLAAPAAQAEPLIQCPGTRAAVAEGETTCAFAANVRRAWFGQPGNPVLAYSPVTGEVYSMMCVRGFTLTFNSGLMVDGATRCVDSDGGTAVAYVW